MLFFLLPLTLLAQTLSQPVRSVTDPGIITTRQAITPAGVPSIFQGRVYGAQWAGETDLWVLHSSDIYRLDWKKNEVRERISHGGSPGPQSIYVDPVTSKVYAANSTRAGSGPVKARLSPRQLLLSIQL